MENQTVVVAKSHKGVNVALIFAGVTTGIYFAIKIVQIIIAANTVVEVIH